MRADPDRRLLTERQAVTAIVAALYSSSSWPVLGSVGDNLSGIDGLVLLSMADAYGDRHQNGTYSSAPGRLHGDQLRRPRTRRPRPGRPTSRLAAQLTRISPLDGGLLGYEQLPCAFWPVKAASRYTGPFDAKGAPPILVIGTTGDPATPYAWAKALASQLDRGVLVTRVGNGHTAYGASACVRSLVERYLISLAPPRNGTFCKS